jgi:hypothetical protein
MLSVKSKELKDPMGEVLMSQFLGQVMIAPGSNVDGWGTTLWPAPYQNPFVSKEDAFGSKDGKGPYGFDLRRYRYACSDGVQRDMTPQEASAMAASGVSCTPVNSANYPTGSGIPGAAGWSLMGRRSALGEFMLPKASLPVALAAGSAVGALTGLGVAYFSKGGSTKRESIKLAAIGAVVGVLGGLVGSALMQP